MFVWLPQVSASAAAAASMRTVLVRFADADAAAYYIATADFIGVSRRKLRLTQDAAFGRGVRRSFLRQRNEQELTQNVDAAAAVGTCGNQTNSPSHYSILIFFESVIGRLVIIYHQTNQIL
ncbi:hypothetical protein F2Q69_00005059 [Brassica cretica]|uniref:Uncharacterized protein n=1 Tax=Brassica cretica TaxID=69181 RepID=A0A8S9P0Y3_BRACR|nr:hypothetical protein F2Q69_00005059 [Brassica cretica]